MEYLKAMFTGPQFFIENNLRMIIKKLFEKTNKISDTLEKMSNVYQLIVII